MSLTIRIYPCPLGWVLRMHHLLLCKVQPNHKITDEWLVRQPPQLPQGPAARLPQAPGSPRLPAQCFLQSRCSGNICQVNESVIKARVKRPTRNDWHTPAIGSPRNLRQEDSNPAWASQKFLSQPELHSEFLCHKHQEGLVWLSWQTAGLECIRRYVRF